MTFEKKVIEAISLYRIVNVINAHGHLHWICLLTVDDLFYNTLADVRMVHAIHCTTRKSTWESKGVGNDSILVKTFMLNIIVKRIAFPIIIG